jgi:hypothetical protein
VRVSSAFPSPVLLFAAVVACLLAPPASAAADAWRPPDLNPCEGSEARELLCPNLRIGPPSEMYVSGYGGRTLLHATSDVRSRGRGPMELHGKRDGPKQMKVTQWIPKRDGGHITVRTDASLHFTDVGEYFGGSYWKVHQLARFTIRPALARGLGPVLRTSPKLNYCLRDLDRTRPGADSPDHRVYPACDQDPSIRRDRLGTSVGWSDIYPADYDKQYIDVSGLPAGCYLFTMTVDPKRLLFESNEEDNSSGRRIRLPFTGAGC